MRLTELHSSRIESLIAAALDKHRHKHECYCNFCENPTENLDDDEAKVRVSDINSRKVAQQILMGLAKLEASIAPAA